jgi:protein TonB
MDFSHEQESSSKRLTGITIVIAIHMLVGFLVVSGIGKRLVEKIKNPVETKIIEEVKPPPPQDLPPPPPPPEIKSPPPPFIPPPEVVVQTPAQQNVVSNATNVAPPKAADVRPQPPAQPAPEGKPQPPAPPARTAAEVSVAACGKPDYPRNAARNEEEGEVTLSFLVGADGRVKESKVDKSSGHRELDKAAQAFLTACNKFKAGTENGKPVESWARVSYTWKLE